MNPAERRCPGCGRPLPARDVAPPFCSERCRLIDLGAWLTDGARAIPGERVPSDDDAPHGSLDENPDGSPGGTPARG